MEDTDLIDNYLSKPYWVVDVLPKQVPANSSGQYFQIEDYIRNSHWMNIILQKQIALLLKLNCYEAINVFHSSEKWVHNPQANLLEKWILEKKPLYVIVSFLNTMLYISGDDLYITIYSTDEEALNLIQSLANSEGLFLWKPQNS